MHQGAALGTAGTRTSEIACSGCGQRAVTGEDGLLRCPSAGQDDDVDHTLRPRLDPQRVRFPGGFEAHPFVRYRELLHVRHAAAEAGVSEGDFLALVADLDAELQGTEGIEQGLAVTPFGRHDALSDQFGFAPEGGVWVKCETSAPTGTHAVRFLAGTALHLRLAEEQGWLQTGEGAAPLAHAGDGHTALAAAALARALGRTCDVFVPSGIPEKRIAHIRSLGTRVHVCPRALGSDDARAASFQAAVARGAIPFAIESDVNGSALDGGRTLGFEILSELVYSHAQLDRLYVQTGGGALAAAIVQAYLDAGELGVPIPLPRVHPVQPAGCAPLMRAYERFARRIQRRLQKALGDWPPCPEDLAGRARWLAEHSWSPIVQEELAYAATHRSAFMWPWGPSPASVADGIRAAQTSDWRLLLETMVRTGGYPVLVEEEALEQARKMTESVTGIVADAAGTAGLAGLLATTATDPPTAAERIGIVLSGLRG